MNMRRNRGRGPFEGVREMPLLFLAFAASLFAGAVIVTNGLMTGLPVETRVRTETVVLDVKAASPSSLIQRSSADPEGLQHVIQNAISSDREIAEDAQAIDGLKIEEGDAQGEVVFSLVGDETLQLQAIDKMNALIAKIVDRLNRQRTEQKESALEWIEETGAGWQARIDRVKEMIAENPFNPDPAKIGGLPDDEKLLRLMIDATSEAQTKGRGDAALQSDLTRLTNVLVELEAGRAVQLEHGTALRNAEVGLARHYEEAALLTAKGGILDRPAADILKSASSSALVRGPAWLPRALGWPIVIPALAVLSLLLALIFTKAVCWLKPSDDVRSDSYLNDPNWPLPPGARREFST